MIIIITVGVLLLFAIFFLLAVEFRYHICLKRDNLAVRIISKKIYGNLKKYDMDFSWWANVYSKNVSINSFDKLKLVGKVVENDKTKFAIVVHGYGARGMEMQNYAKMFCEFGYSVLVPDNRGHGDSKGKFVSMGYYDKFDILKWIEFLNETYNNPSIVVFGLSMGAATVCMLSGLELPTNVKAIVSDCAYTSAYDIFKTIHKKSVIFGILPTMQLFNIYSKKRVGFYLKDANAEVAVSKTKTPILFIHGNKDKFVPFYMHQKLYLSAPQNLREKYVVDGAVHATSIVVGGKEYREKVKSFIEKFVL